MGRIASSLRRLLPGRPVDAVGGSIQTWQHGVAQLPGISYDIFAREGYNKNEIVFACVEELASSAAEPHLCPYRYNRDTGLKEKLPRHAIGQLLDHPNPFLSRYDLWASVIMYLSIAGNAFIEKVRSPAGRVVELWLLRPDRVRIIPDRQTFVGAYQYNLGSESYFLDPADVIHIKNRNLIDDFYGMPPLMPAAGRVDVDNWMRDFVKAFFQNAGVPAGLLNVKRKLDSQDRGLLRMRFKEEYAGPAGWHNLMVIDNGEADYTPMGMPLGARGLIVPELDEIDEARIAMVFAVPLSLIGARLGMQSSSYANRESDRQSFWNETLAPLYRRLAETINIGLVPEFGGVDAVAFDLSEVNALAADVDKLHNRARLDFQAGLVTRQEARIDIGKSPEASENGVFMVPASMEMIPGSRATAEFLEDQAEKDEEMAEQMMLAAGEEGEEGSEEEESKDFTKEDVRKMLADLPEFLKSL